MNVVKIETDQQLTDFILLPHRLYAGNDCYVPELHSTVREQLNPKNNASLDHCDVQAFVAYDDNNVAVGRIIGIVNHHANKRWNTHVVRFSQVEFTDDIEVSRALFQAVADWGQSLGMDTMQGPMGFSDLDKEGMLIEDFDILGSPVTIYNHPYYPEHMQQLGFDKAADWVQLTMKVPEQLPARFARVAQVVREKLHLRVIPLTRHMLTHENYGQQIFHLINESYSDLFGYVPLTDAEINDFVKNYLPVVRLDLVTLVVNEADELVGVAVTMPGLSHALRKADGKLFPTGWWHLLKSIYMKNEDTVMMLLIAVRPDLQGKGVNAIFFEDLLPKFNAHGFAYAETGPQLEDNRKELSQWDLFDAKESQRRRCWTKSLTENR